MSKLFSLAEMKLYSKEECERAKNLMYRFNKECIHLIGPESIGGMVYLHDVFGAKTYEDLFNTWINEELFTSVNDKYKKGRSLDELLELVKTQYNICINSPKAKYLKFELTPLLCWQDILFHAVYQTVDGRKFEDIATELIKKRGKVADHIDPIDDFKYSVDLLLHETDEKSRIDKILQVKPFTFFMGGDWFPETIKKILYNMKKSKDKFKCEYYFIIYVDGKNKTSNKWLFNEKNNSSLFSIEDLLDMSTNKLLLDKDGKRLIEVIKEKNALEDIII